MANRSSSSRSSGYHTFSWWRDGALPVVILGAMAYGLWQTRPLRSINYTPAGSITRTQSCLSNLGRIAISFAQYAQDYDGKFPRGTDPEDHYFPQLWGNPAQSGFTRYGGIYYDDARTAPLLHNLLFPYLRDRKVWHCPDDVGWTESRLYQSVEGLSASQLRNIKPSSWARFGTSYYYMTIHGFAGLRAADIAHPGHDVVLFDGDLWHHAEGGGTVNGLFADGHAQNMTSAHFGEALNVKLP
ncbi:MAG: hypothetical protein JO316_20250 [Abitibacteriaceae bacterium]|nr:hypothetical protein [Abditibacteriaceae bacterium]MBV9867690.1 hypothetical protein [Abditibacteriaceae bacterium]